MTTRAAILSAALAPCGKLDEAGKDERPFGWNPAEPYPLPSAVPLAMEVTVG